VQEYRDDIPKRELAYRAVVKTEGETHFQRSFGLVFQKHSRARICYLQGYLRHAYARPSATVLFFADVLRAV
jgi:hypothetical protein